MTTFEAMLETVRPYVPNLVMQRFSNGSEGLKKAEMNTFNAAVAFFDISGFSKLASRLQREELRISATGGKRERRSVLASAKKGIAAEKLTQMLNSALGTLLFRPILHV